jgi:peptidoglycan L-alanyl-D-glutamate endopeptidase CwlK
MSKSDEQAKFLLDTCLLIQYATRLGFKVTGDERYRPQEMQEIYYRTGRSRTLNSQHLDKLADDYNFFLNGRYINGLKSEEAEQILRPLGIFWESLDPKNRWGGNFDKDFSRKDPWIDSGHFERQD